MPYTCPILVCVHPGIDGVERGPHLDLGTLSMAGPLDPAVGPGSRRAYHKGNVAADLRKVAACILATERLEDVTLRRLTREVGVTPANFYNHFRSLDELLFSLAAGGFSELTERAAAIMTQGGDKADILVTWAIDFVRFAVNNRELARVMFRKPESEYHEFQMAAQRAVALLVHFLYEEEYRPTPPVAMSQQYGAAVGYIALWYGLAHVALDGFFDLDASNDDELTSFVENSVRPIVDNLVVAGLTRRYGRSET